MKAIVLLLCVALARDCASSIFKEKFPQNLVIQKVLYFDEPEHQRHRQYKYQQYPTQDVYNQEQQHAQSSESQEEDRVMPQENVYQNQRISKQQYTPYQVYQDSQEYQNQYMNKYQPRYQNQASYKQQQHKLQFNQRQMQRQNQDSQQESQEQMNRKLQTSQQQDSQEQRQMEQKSQTSQEKSQINVMKNVNQPQSQEQVHEYLNQNHQVNQQESQENQQNNMNRKKRGHNKRPASESTQQSQENSYQNAYVNSDSSESNSIENEMRQMNYGPYNMYQRPRNAAKTNTHQNHNQKQMRPTHTDSIQWKGLVMAVGPNSPIQNEEDIQKIYESAYNTLQHLSNVEKAKYAQEVEAAVEDQKNDNAKHDAVELLTKYNYAYEQHSIKTDDGYNLTMFRVLSTQKSSQEQRPVVFLVSGLLGSADDWLLKGPNHSLAYLLADTGYDVWLGSTRGSRYSSHASKHPAQADFWQYSVDDIALHDLPAMIDYILETSNEQKLYYVGHSQGNTVMFALAAARPEYNNKVAVMFAISPMVYMTNVRSPLIRMIAPNSPFYERLHEQLANSEFTSNKELIHTVGGEMCEDQIGSKSVCSSPYFVISGIDVNEDIKTIPAIINHENAVSARQLEQYGQGVVSDEFRRFDFGADVNEQVYGQQEPPRYNLERVQIPVSLFYGDKDWLSHETDVQRLQTALPNVLEANKLRNFTHMDFQFSNKAMNAVYKRLMTTIQQNSRS